MAPLSLAAVSNSAGQSTSQSTTADGGTRKVPIVRFHAWGGSAQVNGYLQWVAEQVKQRFNIELQHIKLADTSDAVSRVLAEKAAGNHHNGSVDLIWINGENFAAMKKHNLLSRAWVEELENFALTNPRYNTAMTTDFGEATLGMEAPWGKASMVFYYRSAHMKSLGLMPPNTIRDLLRFSQKAPGHFTYPVPSDYLGISFIKFAVIVLNREHQSLFYQPVTAESLQTVLPALWAYLDALHPTMWQAGNYMLRQASQLQRLVSTGELTLAFSFTASEIPSAVTRFDLPEDVRTYVMQDGSLANVHFIGLTYNSSNTEAAKTIVNFLLSPEAQAEKQKLAVWGDDTVLDMSILPKGQQALFENDTIHDSALDKSQQTMLLPEPHASWTDALRDAWYARYGARY
ncbi:ABC transporter substrate-binding protein [Aestuariibacter sp. A3R04]|nr:ABC transporter substrate-binding protein [Aestuariibacter sp. A3R04]